MLARALACGVLLVLTGCFIPKLRPSQTGMGLPDSYDGTPNGVNGATISGETAAENSARLRVDEFYNDPALVRLICQAVAANRELKSLEEDIQIAQAEVLSRRGAFLPLMGLRAGVDTQRYSKYTLEGASRQDDPYRFNPDKLLPNPVPNFLLGLNLFLPLDIWRELRNARDAAVQRYFAAVERRNYFVTRLVADVAENYYGLMALDRRLVYLDQIIAFQEQSRDIAAALLKAGRGSLLAVQRFEAEVNKNRSEKLIVRQEIVEVENRINLLLGRLPQPVGRDAAAFLDLTIHPLNLGVPAQLLQNRPDVRRAERELAAAGLDVQVTRARFFPRVDITAGIGYSAFNPAYLFSPQSLVFNAAGELAAPLINKAAIRADYRVANARQLQAVYNYQQVIIDATIEVINRISMVQNYSRSIELKKQQVQALDTSVTIATQLWQRPRVGEPEQIKYLDVLLVQRDLLDARMILINTKRQQLSAIVNVYQALGGGVFLACPPPDQPLAAPEPQRLPEVERLPPQPEPGQLPPPRPVPTVPKEPARPAIPAPPGGE